jgi:hypothetical protein
MLALVALYELFMRKLIAASHIGGWLKTLRIRGRVNRISSAVVQARHANRMDAPGVRRLDASSDCVYLLVVQMGEFLDSRNRTRVAVGWLGE